MKYIRKNGEVFPTYIIDEYDDTPSGSGWSCMDVLMMIFIGGCMLFLLSLIFVIIFTNL